MTRKLLAFLLVAVLVVVMALAAVAGVTFANLRISQMPQPLWRAAATLAEIVAGVFWLLATVFLATRLAVLIFAGPDPPSEPPPRA